MTDAEQILSGGSIAAASDSRMFEGKTVMITGASVGIGRGCALLFARQRASLALLDINVQTLAALKEELKPYGVNVFTCACDISNERQVLAATEDAAAQLGKIDILVNNAALWRCWAPFLEVSADEWKRFLDVNIMGTVYCTRAVLGGMISRGYGRIINVASVAGVYGNANMVHYSATKGALIAMTRALAKEVAACGVTVNCVSPGSVSSSDQQDIYFTQPSDLSFMGRTGSDAENAAAIVFLAGDGGSYISGQNIQIDGCRKKQ